MPLPFFKGDVLGSSESCLKTRSILLQENNSISAIKWCYFRFHSWIAVEFKHTLVKKCLLCLLEVIISCLTYESQAILIWCIGMTSWKSVKRFDWAYLLHDEMGICFVLLSVATLWEKKAKKHNRKGCNIQKRNVSVMWAENRTCGVTCWLF